MKMFKLSELFIDSFCNLIIVFILLFLRTFIMYSKLNQPYQALYGFTKFRSFSIQYGTIRRRYACFGNVCFGNVCFYKLVLRKLSI